MKAHGGKLAWFSHGLKSWEVACRQAGKTPAVDILIDEFNLHYVLVQTCDANKATYHAESVYPHYTLDLTLFEHEQIKADLKAKGKADIDSLEPYELQKLRYELHRKLAEAAETGRRERRALVLRKEAARLAALNRPAISPAPAVPPPLPKSAGSVPPSSPASTSAAKSSNNPAPQPEAVTSALLSLFSPSGVMNVE